MTFSYNSDGALVLPIHCTLLASRLLPIISWVTSD
jgi:hypothetical protein